MSELQDLYQELILDHNRRPRNHGRLEACSCHADGHNPLCGDKLVLDVQLEDDRIVDLAFESVGCAISTASASIMSESIKGKTIEEARGLFARFHEMVTAPAEEPVSAELGKLNAFAGVRRYPARVKCATLAWHTLAAALDRSGDVATTE